jgi:hypothetical protein
MSKPEGLKDNPNRVWNDAGKLRLKWTAHAVGLLRRSFSTKNREALSTFHAHEGNGRSTFEGVMALVVWNPNLNEVYPA